MADNAFSNQPTVMDTAPAASLRRRFLDKAGKRPLLFCAAGLLALTVFSGGVVAARLQSAPPQFSGIHVAISVHPDAIPLRTTDADDALLAELPVFAGNSGNVSAPVRQTIDSEIPAVEKFSRSVRFPHSRAGLVTLSRGKVRIATADGPVTLAGLRKAAEAPAHVPASFFSQETDFTETGPRSAANKGPAAPWPFLGSFAEDETLVCRIEQRDGLAPLRRLLGALHLPATGANYASQASKYKTAVSAYADKYNIASTLVLAIMHTESNFNPFAVSPSQAVGLMQVVPETAGSEVHRYLTGIPAAPSLETLFVPEHNIRYGTTYLHLLGNRYFGGVANRTSRQLCIIAAYNGGPGAVLRMFAPDDRDEAVSKINSMTPEQVYTALTTQMPNAETRRYVELVTGRMQTYSVN